MEIRKRKPRHVLSKDTLEILERWLRVNAEICSGKTRLHVAQLFTRQTGIYVTQGNVDHLIKMKGLDIKPSFTIERAPKTATRDDGGWSLPPVQDATSATIEVKYVRPDFDSRIAIPQEVAHVAPPVFAARTRSVMESLAEDIANRVLERLGIPTEDRIKEIADAQIRAAFE